MASTLSGLQFTFLTEELPQVPKDVQLPMQQTMWFMHGGAHAYFTCNVKQFVDSRYPDKGEDVTAFVASTIAQSHTCRLQPMGPWGTVYSKGINKQDELWHLIQVTATTNNHKTQTWNFSEYQKFLASQASVMHSN
jgi:hypothetical protein